MLELFFCPEGDLPAGCGFSHFDRGHLAALGCLAGVSVLVILAGIRLRPKAQERLLRWMAAGMVGMELVKDLILGVMGAFSVGYLPLHLCSISMFICLYAAWHGESKLAGALVWSLCGGGGMAALVFPDWTALPLLHFQSLLSFVYHAMLVQFALIAVCTGRAKPRLGQVLPVLGVLVGLAIPIYGINLRLGTNYMFLNRPVKNSPLEFCGAIPGRWGYLGGYVLLAGGILVGMNLPFSLWAWRHDKK